MVVKVGEDPPRYIFSQLLFLFEIEVAGRRSQQALILPLDERLRYDRRLQESDRALRLTRVRARPREGSVVVTVESILRGALVVQDLEATQKDEYLVIEAVDEDLWWRMKDLPRELQERANLPGYTFPR